MQQLLNDDDIGIRPADSGIVVMDRIKKSMSEK